MRLSIAVVMLVSIIGIVYSIRLVIDARKDDTIRTLLPSPLAMMITRARLIDEVSRLTAQVMFLVAAGLAGLDLLPRVRLGLVVLIPILLMVWSGWSSRTRTRILTEEIREKEE